LPGFFIGGDMEWSNLNLWIAKGSSSHARDHKILRAAELWAEEMEKRRKEGFAIWDIAEPTLPMLGEEVTISSYECRYATLALAECWKYGGELLEWFDVYPTRQKPGGSSITDHHALAQAVGAERKIFSEEEKMRIKDPEDRRRIQNLTVRLLSSMVEKGELNPENNEDLKKATKEMAEVARSSYYAALEYLS
jgi:hypothetical protein